MHTQAPDVLLTHAGVLMPRLLYGTAWKAERTAQLVEAALRAGFRGIDTAAQPKHYDEAGVGAGLAEVALPRDALYVQTKFTPLDGQDRTRLPYDLAAPLEQQIEQSVAGSLRKLGCDYLDTLLLHSPLHSRGATLRAWQAMESCVARGAVRQLGISNCYALAEFDALYRAASIKPAVLQNRFYARTRHDRELRAYCRAHEVVYQSFWTLTANPEALASSTLRNLALRHRCAPAQILYRYLTQIDVVPLIGTCSTAHMREDLAIFDFTLEPRECDAVSLLF
jgi:diketogulonate reductase-like aldo/keto reductase